jgi:hypothetical protein
MPKLVLFIQGDVDKLIVRTLTVKRALLICAMHINTNLRLDLYLASGIATCQIRIYY